MNRVLLENGTAGEGGLNLRELGYNSADLDFSFKAVAGFVHVPTAEKLLLAAAAATSGAAGVGYFASGGLTADNIQDAIDELEALIAAGGGGTVLGSGTVGNIPKLTGASTLGNSILSEASSKLVFSGDSSVNLYRLSAGILATDGAFSAAGNIFSTASIQGDSLEISTLGTFYGDLDVQGDSLMQGLFQVGSSLVATGAPHMGVQGILGFGNPGTAWSSNSTWTVAVGDIIHQVPVKYWNGTSWDSIFVLTR